MEERLKAEIEKWSLKLNEKRASLHATKEAEGQLRIADDYIEDSRHFLKEGQLVESFEAIVYAWAIIETLERLDLVSS